MLITTEEDSEAELELESDDSDDPDDPEEPDDSEDPDEDDEEFDDSEYDEAEFVYYNEDDEESGCPFSCSSLLCSSFESESEPESESEEELYYDEEDDSSSYDRGLSLTVTNYDE